MELINLTPHSINIGASTILSSGIARVSVELKTVYISNGIEFVRGSYGQVTDLPDPSFGKVFIVSSMVRAALPQRHDLASPAKLIRDENGTVIGCGALEVN